MAKIKVSKKAPEKSNKLKINIKKIWQEKKLFAESCKKMALTGEDNALMKVKLPNIFDEEEENPSVQPKLDFMNNKTKFNIPFNEDSYPDTTTACSQRLLILSMEQNELQCNIHYNHLMNAKWWPEFNVCMITINITFICCYHYLSFF